MSKSSINPDIDAYIQFMKSHYTSKKLNPDAIITHTLMGPIAPGMPGKGSFYIEGLDYEKFMKLYKKLIRYRLLDLHIVERPKRVGPLVIDIDFKTKRKHKERQYLDKHITYIVEKFNRLFKKYFDLDKASLKAYVFEKPTPTHEPDKDLYKDGFHIIYSDIPIDVPKRYFLFDIVKQEVIEEDGFGDIPFANTYNEIFDVSVINSNGILMYGSHKEGREPYSLTKIYKHNMKPDFLDNYDDDELISILSIRRFSDEDDTPLKQKYLDSPPLLRRIEECFNKSVSKTQRKQMAPPDATISNIDVDENATDGPANPNPNSNISAPKFDPKEDPKSDIALVKHLVNIFSVERATNYDDWTKVCWALNSISPTKLKSTFIDFSRKSKTKFDKAKCEELWEQAYVGTYSIGTLHWWARQDSPQEYTKIIRERVKDLVNKAESGTHDDIANVIKEMYGHLYKCVSNTKNIWYEFQEHRWVQIDSAYTLQNKITDEVVREFYHLHSHYLNEAAQSKEGLNHDDAIAKGKKITKIYEKLKTTNFIEQVVKACARKFYDRKFEEKLDSHPHLIGCDNGVIDLSVGQFRPGIPDDYMSMSVGYNYDPNCNKNDPATVKKIQKYFETVQPDPKLREYVMRLLSSFLDGNMKDQKLMIWTGVGCHAGGELIRMHDKSVKEVQNIKLGDLLMGDDGRERHVSAIYGGIATMYEVICFNAAKTKIKITSNHRLALRSHYGPYISETHDEVCDKQIFWAHFHEIMDDGIVESTNQFYSREEAELFLESNPSVVKEGEIIPITVEQISRNRLERNGFIEKYYRLVMFEDQTEPHKDLRFTIVPLLDLELYYGLEVDGNKRYVMGCDLITYNSNGKSTTIDLVTLTLGEYAGVLPTTIVTRKQGAAGAATPELADKRGKRFLVINEPEHDDTIHLSLMKQLTAGNDLIPARALYGNPFYYKPQFKLVLPCNDLPIIPNADGGTWRRIRVTPWKIKFVDGVPKGPLECKKDTKLGAEMKGWGPAFLWILVNTYYPRYNDPDEEVGGLQEPEEVTKHTNEYKKDSDMILEFLEETIEKTGSQDDNEPIDMVYGAFKPWCEERGLPKKAVKSRREFVSYLTKANYIVTKNAINGIKMANQK